MTRRIVLLNHLDAPSLHALRRMAAATVFMLVCITALTALRGAGAREMAASLTVAFSVAAFVSMVTAALRRERAGQGSLNGWDESLAFDGLAIMAHLITQLSR